MMSGHEEEKPPAAENDSFGDLYPTVEELRARNLPPLTVALLGTEFKCAEGSTQEEFEAEVALITAAFDAYLADFVPGPECPRCNQRVGGMFGTFVFGLQRDEGHCGYCRWPCRARHNVPYGEGTERAGTLRLRHILAFHPNSVVDTSKVQSSTRRA